MECVILLRMPNGRIAFMTDGDNDGELAVFANRDDAVLCVRGNPIIAAGWPFQVVECDEL